MWLLGAASGDWPVGTFTFSSLLASTVGSRWGYCHPRYAQRSPCRWCGKALFLKSPRQARAPILVGTPEPDRFLRTRRRLSLATSLRTLLKAELHGYARSYPSYFKVQRTRPLMASYFEHD